MKRTFLLPLLTVVSLGMVGCGAKTTINSTALKSVSESASVISDKADDIAVTTQAAAVTTEPSVSCINLSETAAAPESSIDLDAIKPFVSCWNYQESDNNTVNIDGKNMGVVSIHEDGTYKYTDNNGTVKTGTVEVNIENIGGTELMRLDFSGDPFKVNGAYYVPSMPDELHLGNGGAARLVHGINNMTYSETVVEKLSFFNNVNKTNNSGVAHKDTAAFSIDGADYYEVTDFTMIPSMTTINDHIDANFAGSMRDTLKSGLYCRFMEKDGVLYEVDGGMESYVFNTGSSFAITDVTEDHFKATGIEVDTIRSESYGTAEFVKEDGKWKLSSFTCND